MAEIAESGSNDSPVPAAAWAEPDYLLQNYVRLCNSLPDLKMSITLSVGGILVTGWLVSGRRFYDEGLSEIFAGEEYKESRARMHEIGAQLYPENDDDANRVTAFIHLQDAHFVAPGQRPTRESRGVWWRGRLTAVDGWNWGVLTVD